MCRAEYAKQVDVSHVRSADAEKFNSPMGVFQILIGFGSHHFETIINRSTKSLNDNGDDDRKNANG